MIEYVSSAASSPNDPNSYNFQVAVVHGNQSEFANFKEMPDVSPYSAVSQLVRLYANADTPV